MFSAEISELTPHDRRRQGSCAPTLLRPCCTQCGIGAPRMPRDAPNGDVEVGEVLSEVTTRQA